MIRVLAVLILLLAGPGALAVAALAFWLLFPYGALAFLVWALAWLAFIRYALTVSTVEITPMREPLEMGESVVFTLRRGDELVQHARYDQRPPPPAPPASQNPHEPVNY